AEKLAAEFGGRAVRFDECLEGMGEADIVVSSTGSPETILRREDIADVMRARRNRPLFLIDIAVPRDIDPDVQQLNDAYLYNGDRLERLVRENAHMREQELTKCGQILRERRVALMAKFAGSPSKNSLPETRPETEWILNGEAAARASL